MKRRKVKTDLIVLNNTRWEDICYHFIGTELQIIVNFSAVNSSESFSRLVAGEDFLMVTLALWLKNRKYRHIVFSFEDSFKTELDFNEHNRQLLQAAFVISNGSLLHATSFTNAINVRFDYNLTENVSFSKLSLRLIHIQPNNVTFISLPLLSQSRTMMLGSLGAGTEQHFSMSLSSCGLTSCSFTTSVHINSAKFSHPRSC